MTDAGQALYAKARRLIPGGTQMLSKRPEMFLPGGWPSYYARARGVEVWDLEGRRYIEASICGGGGPVLGFADPEVDAAVTAAVQAGSTSTLNCPEEVALAALLLELHPWAAMVRFARGGAEALAVAVRIARASTGRDIVAFCGYHGWSDWYLAANLGTAAALDGHLLPGLQPAGVPRGLAGTAYPFRYNHADDLEVIVAQHGPQLAAIVMEPMRATGPEPGFLEAVRETASRAGAVLVFDEVTSAWRMNTGGFHITRGVAPDLAVFSKALANGYPMAAVIGTDEVMEAAQRSFISSTNWTERIGPAAALATIRKHRREDVPAHLIRIGTMVQQGWRDVARSAELRVSISGIPPLSFLRFEYDNAVALSTLFTQEMLDRGYLASTAFYVSYAHQDGHVSAYLEAAGEVFAILARAIGEQSVERRLRGPVQHTGFARLT